MFALIAYLTADLAVRTLPVRVTDVLARVMARLAFVIGVPARRQLEANLARLLGGPLHGAAVEPASGATAAEPPPSRAIRARALESFEHFALAFADFLRMARLRPDALPATVEVRGSEHLAAAHASSHGVIVFSAHVGNWEWGAAYLATQVERVHLVARPHPSRWVEAFFARRRGRWKVSRLCGGPLWLAASKALRRREWVALMGDRASSGSAAAQASAASLCAWVAALSRRTGAVVLPAVMLRLANGRYAACFEAPLNPDACRNGGYRDAIRRHLLSHPGQWFAFERVPEGLA
jgi:lauroyl/myristoyl acyltransferase